MLDEKLEEKLTEVFDVLENSSFLMELDALKRKLLSDSSFMKKVKEYQNMDSYSLERDNLKTELYQNEDYFRYQVLENEILFLILKINQKFSSLMDKKGCR